MDRLTCVRLRAGSNGNGLTAATRSALGPSLGHSPENRRAYVVHLHLHCVRRTRSCPASANDPNTSRGRTEWNTKDIVFSGHGVCVCAFVVQCSSVYGGEGTGWNADKTNGIRIAIVVRAYKRGNYCDIIAVQYAVVRRKTIRILGRAHGETERDYAAGARMKKIYEKIKQFSFPCVCDRTVSNTRKNERDVRVTVRVSTYARVCCTVQYYYYYYYYYTRTLFRVYVLFFLNFFLPSDV
jgi:hypothetical protein